MAISSRRSRARLSVAGLVLVAIAGCSSGPSIEVRSADGFALPTSPPTKPGRLAWGECEDPELDDGGLDCATLSVPLEHDRPDGEHIDIALARLPASEEDERIGAILVNPGGPGGSGIDYVDSLSIFLTETFGDELGDRFDLIGFDPRGVGASGAIQCVDDAWLDAHVNVDAPDTPEEQALFDNADAEFVAGCKRALGEHADDYSTVATAHDMDLIRAALGDEQISYLGTSYGTYLGGVYATLHPDRVRAMVLDSALSPVGDDPFQQLSTQIVGFEHAFDNWAAWCDEDDTCALHGGAAGRWDALVDELDTTSLAVAERTVNQSVLFTATIASLYSESTWPVLAQALADAEAGDGAALLSLADFYQGRDADGHYDSQVQAQQIISCASGFSNDPLPDPAAALEELQRLAPRFAASITVEDLEEADTCQTLTGTVEPQALSYAGTAPIMVVGGVNDPATPFRWAEKMAGELNGTLVTYEGEGHASIDASRCVAEAAAALLVDLERPEPGLTCGADPPTSAPDWWGDLPELDGFTLSQAGGVSELLGFPPDLYADVVVAPEGAPTDEIADLLTAAYEEDGWDLLATEDLPIGDDAQQLVMERDGHILGLSVLGTGSLSSPDGVAFAPYAVDGHAIVMRFSLGP